MPTALVALVSGLSVTVNSLTIDNRRHIASVIARVAADLARCVDPIRGTFNPVRCSITPAVQSIVRPKSNRHIQVATSPEGLGSSLRDHLAGGHLSID